MKGLKQGGESESEKQQSYSGDGGETVKEDFKESLRDEVDEPFSEKDTGNERRKKQRVELKGFRVDEFKLSEKRNFKDIDEEKKPGAHAEKILFFHLVNQSPDRINRPGGIGQHRGDADENTTQPSEEAGVRKMFEKRFLKLTDQLKGQHEKDDHSDNAAGGQFIERVEQQPGADDGGESHGDKRPDHLPARILPEERIDEKITNDEHRQNDADAVFCAEEFRNDENIDDRQPRKSGFRDAKAQRTEAGEEEGKSGSVKREVHWILP